MIPLTASNLQGYDWKNQLAQAVRDPQTLINTLELPPELLPGATIAARLFPLRVPPAYLRRIKKGDPNDPLLRQILPINLETEDIQGFCNDPVGDLDAQVTPGLLHKYHGRALWVTTGACAIHCRYCFRRHFPYHEAMATQQNWLNAVDYLEKHEDIHEIILSGGDPLSLSDNRLFELFGKLESIQHLTTLRIHSRLPIVVPQRITPPLIQALAKTRLRTVFVAHINHANEIDSEVQTAMHRLREIGVTLLNQSVLLKGVNDSTEALRHLSEALFNVHILPYYLHQLDKVRGAAHFAVDNSRAKQLIMSLTDQLPGYLVPRLVFEQAGQLSKTPLFSL